MTALYRSTAAMLLMFLSACVNYTTRTWAYEVGEYEGAGWSLIVELVGTWHELSDGIHERRSPYALRMRLVGEGATPTEPRITSVVLSSTGPEPAVVSLGDVAQVQGAAPADGVDWSLTFGLLHLELAHDDYELSGVVETVAAGNTVREPFLVVLTKDYRERKVRKLVSG